MTDRLAAATTVVPDLAAHAKALRSVFDRVARLDGLAVQQIHGDLHLGQTLRTASGWKIVDFEGEPAKPLAERQLPDSPWRDVAGMLRSFDYAPRVVERAMTEGERADGHQEQGQDLSKEAEQWAERNKNHFLTAYAGGALSSRAADLAGRLRRGQGRLRDRLRDPQPPDLAARSRSRPWRRSEQHDDPHDHPVPRRPPRPAGRARPAGRRRARQPALDPRAAPARRRGHRPRLQAARAHGRGPPRRRHRLPARARARGRLGRRPARRGRARLPARGLLRRRARARRRRPVPLPAHPRRDRPAPDQRGPARAAVGGARRPGAPLRHPARRPDQRHRVRGLGTVGPRRAAQGDFNGWDGREHPMRQLGQSGVWELFVPGVGSGTGYKYVGPRRRRTVAREGRPDGVVRRAARGHGVEGLRVAATSGATRTGWTPGPPSSTSPSRCRSTRCTWRRGAATRAGTSWPTSCRRTSPTSASPTSS